MIKALLFDLDDTLLSNELNQFIGAYFKRLLAHLPAARPAETVFNALLAGTQAMRRNTDPRETLYAVFERQFSALTGWPPAEWWPMFQDFYAGDFNALQAHTQPVAGARQLVQWAVDNGYAVAVATSPLFPHTAIAARLQWAGVADLPWARITSLDNSRFAKPNPHYYAELLAHLGLRPEEALMIGNDLNEDILPTAALGVPAFWVTAPGTPAPAGAAPVGVGALADFAAWARERLADYAPPPPPPESLPWQLTGTLAAILSVTAELTPAQWTARPADTAWSPAEIICHLRDVSAEVNLPRIQAALTQDNPFLPGVDSDSWAEARGYAAQSGPMALADFTANRQKVLDTLAGLTAADWQRPARHAIFGPTTLAELVSFMADHDRLHLKQLTRGGG